MSTLVERIYIYIYTHLTFLYVSILSCDNRSGFSLIYPLLMPQGWLQRNAPSVANMTGFVSWFKTSQGVTSCLAAVVLRCLCNRQPLRLPTGKLGNMRVLRNVYVMRWKLTKLTYPCFQKRKVPFCCGDCWYLKGVMSVLSVHLRHI